MKFLLKIILLVTLALTSFQAFSQGNPNNSRYCLDGSQCREVNLAVFEFSTGFQSPGGMWFLEQSIVDIFPEENVVFNGSPAVSRDIDVKISNGCAGMEIYRRKFHSASGFYIDERDACLNIQVGRSIYALPRPMDTDFDGVDDSIDNCPNDYNPDQSNDLDDDGVGDICDSDIDGDTIPNNAPDNCLMVRNKNQANRDGDPLGDACDPDDDNDTVPDHLDNCPFDSNVDQFNVDPHLDNNGDACDPNSDGDGISDDNDNCPFEDNDDQIDSDGDNNGNACDLDDDDDTILDDDDNCQFKKNVNQIDSNGNGVGDACEPVVQEGDILDLLPAIIAAAVSAKKRKSK